MIATNTQVQLDGGATGVVVSRQQSGGLPGVYRVLVDGQIVTVPEHKVWPMLACGNAPPMLRVIEGGKGR